MRRLSYRTARPRVGDRPSSWDHVPMTLAITTRLANLRDAVPLAQIQRSSREALPPFEPERSEQYFTEAGQRAVLENALREHGQGVTVPHVIVVDGVVAGRITLSGIIRGPFLSANLGYWVVPALHGRGIATAAVQRMIRVAFEDQGLHR